jgi:hypothetical protein
MPKTKNDAATGERTKVDVTDAEALRYWTDRFGVTAVRVKDAVAAVGTSPVKVEEYLKR